MPASRSSFPLRPAKRPRRGFSSKGCWERRHPVSLVVAADSEISSNVREAFSRAGARVHRSPAPRGQRLREAALFTFEESSSSSSSSSSTLSPSSAEISLFSFFTPTRFCPPAGRRRSAARSPRAPSAARSGCPSPAAARACAGSPSGRTPARRSRAFPTATRLRSCGATSTRGSAATALAAPRRLGFREEAQRARAHRDPPGRGRNLAAPLPRARRRQDGARELEDSLEGEAGRVARASGEALPPLIPARKSPITF